MEDGNCPTFAKGEGYESKTKPPLLIAEKSNIPHINGHSVNGIDLQDCKLPDVQSVYVQHTAKYLNDKYSGQHYPLESGGEDVATLKGNKKSLCNFITRGHSVVSNVTEVQKSNNVNKNDVNSGMTYYDEHTKTSKSDNIDQLKVDRNRKKVFKDRPLNTQSIAKFKCSRCKSASFKSFGLLNEHQRECDVSYKRPAADSQRNKSRKVYLCSVCGTYYENWNLFLHMREVHNRHICLFCLGMFSKAERLASHLVVKHDVCENKFSDIKDFFSVYSGSLLLMCCCCDKVHTEKDNFTFHECIRISKNPAVVNSVAKTNQKIISTVCKQNQTVNTINVFQDSCRRNDVLNSNNGVLNGGQVTVKRISTVEKQIESEKHIVNTPITNAISEPPGSLSDVKQFGMDIEMQSFADDELDNEVQNITKSFCNEMVNEDVFKPDNSTTILNANKEDAMDDDKLSIPMEIEQSNNNNESVISPSLPQDKVVLKLKPSAIPTANKPPKRNRRPPKRYEYDIDDAGNKQEHKILPENTVTPNFVEDTTEAIVEMPIPKLKVKLPKIMNVESESESSSEPEEKHETSQDLEDTNEQSACDMNNDTISDVTPVCNEVNDEPTIINESDVAVAGEEVPLVELTLDKPLDKYPISNLLRTFLSSTIDICIYCNHARKIAVNGKQLALHFLSQHRFCATVNSITAEELLPETISAKVKASLSELTNSFLNLETYDSDDKSSFKDYDHVFECFQCYFVTSVHKELYLHSRKMHQKTMLLCIMCKSTFYSYSELLCHLCPGTYDQDTKEMSYRCCLCESDSIPSSFRLMVHLRKRHHACEVCLEKCCSQSNLSNHVWKHKLHHFCYRCNIAYRNKPDITKHLFWKHGTESVPCKTCLQKKWPHVYHFCTMPINFACEECSLTFSKAVALKVHKRIHNGDTPYGCTEENCTEKFISKKILEKHLLTHTSNYEEPNSDCDKHIYIDVVNPIRETIPTAESEMKTNTSVSASGEDTGLEKIKTKKAKRDKKIKDDKDNLLIDVNLPALNLSESDSDESETENAKADSKTLVKFNDPENSDALEGQTDQSKEEMNALQIWDNFNQYQAEIKRQDKQITIVKMHVCDSDHDYCLIPSENCSENDNKFDKHIKLHDKKKKKKSRKKQPKDGYSSLSDSSSDSGTTCSCKSNCSCSSSSNSSSSSTSSDSDSSNDLDKKLKRTSKANRRNKKNSESSHTSAVDIMATEEHTPVLLLASAETQIPECDLVTDESDTDEDFYDDDPFKAASRLIAEKRPQTIVSDAEHPIAISHQDAESPIGNDSVLIATSPSVEKIKKRTKPKKKKRPRKYTSLGSTANSNPSVEAPVAQTTTAQTKITISLQKNIAQLPEVTVLNNNVKSMSAINNNKRASKRKRVPNKFYGYSSDEEFAFKPQQPPKLEWRKEDLPSPTPSPSFAKAIPTPPEFQKTIPPLIISKPIISPVISSDDSDSSVDGDGELQICHSNSPETTFEEKKPSIEHSAAGRFRSQMPFPKPAGARQAREGESVYCYCRCPYDEVSEMIACDGDGCNIEWFHFECVGILVPPKGKWYCPQCEAKLHPNI